MVIPTILLFLKSDQNEPYYNDSYHWPWRRVHTVVDEKFWQRRRSVPGVWKQSQFALTYNWKASSCPGVWMQTWLASSSPRRASTRPWRGSAELVVIRTSPTPSGGSLSFVIGISESPVDVSRKAKNRNWPNYNCSFFITLFRKLSKHTTYLPEEKWRFCAVIFSFFLAAILAVLNRRWICWEKLKIEIGLTITVLFYKNFLEIKRTHSVHTLPTV